MARRKRRSGNRMAWLWIVVVAALAAGAWYLLQHHRLPMLGNGPVTDTTAQTVSAERIDARNEERSVSVSGTLHATHPARDKELGISADAIALLREVQMMQWQEHCAGAGCEYSLAWSTRHVDSHAFRDPQGHTNAAPFPFSTQHFVADEVRLGAFVVDAALVATVQEANAYPVSVAQLPPNLAATFRDCDGALCTGADPAHPAAGDLRVSYRIVASGARTLTGVQRGDRLTAPPH
jgi:hypothetical protein